LIIKKYKAAEIVSQVDLASTGLEWWNSFLENRVPGEMGKRLHEILQDGGTNDFAH